MWRGLLGKNTKPAMSAPAASAASRVGAVERPQILTMGVIAASFDQSAAPVKGASPRSPLHALAAFVFTPPLWNLMAPSRVAHKQEQRREAFSAYCGFSSDPDRRLSRGRGGGGCFGRRGHVQSLPDLPPDRRECPQFCRAGAQRGRRPHGGDCARLQLFGRQQEFGPDLG